MKAIATTVRTFTTAALVSVLGLSTAPAGEPASDAEQPYRILHIMSYHAPWRWTDGQLEGFKEGLGDVRAEYKVFQMDAKRESGPEQVARKAREARALIEEWQPDLVYTTDDAVQEHVVEQYVGSDLPFVFSGVNKAPSTYGFDAADNVTGVIEQEHFVQSVKLLKRLVPDIEKFAVVFDDARMWEPVEQRMREQLDELPDVEFTRWDTIHTFAEYKSRIRDYQETVDAIALIGIFNFKDADGRNVPYQEVLKWTAQHSDLPDFGYWVDRVHYGTLAAMTVSEREQGLAAGRIARSILVDGKNPGSIPMKPTVKGIPVISLARANRLDIRIKSSLLLSAEVIREFEWNE